MAAEQPSTDRSRPVLVSLTKYIAYPGITHAGGQYLLNHIAALSETFDLTHIAPNTPLNRDALARDDVNTERNTLIGPKLSGFRFALLKLESIWSGSSVYRPVRKLFRAHKAPWQTLENAAIIELQWSEMIALAPLIRRRLPNARIVGIAHDVITQRLERQTERELNPLKLWLLQIAARRARTRERASFAALDLLVVFSRKDAELAHALAPELRIEVVHPAVGPAEGVPVAPESDQPNVLFVGAMNRPENTDAVTWFITHIWPRVLERVAEATFTVAGAHPSTKLQELAANTRNIEFTGFVQSFDEVFAKARMCVVPLRRGAGVKFKTVEALMRGVPVVSTSVGAEGIEAQHLLTAITDDANLFAERTITALTSANPDLVTRARDWATATYAFPSFAKRITELYQGVMHDKPAS